MKIGMYNIFKNYTENFKINELNEKQVLMQTHKSETKEIIHDNINSYEHKCKVLLHLPIFLPAPT